MARTINKKKAGWAFVLLAIIFLVVSTFSLFLGPVHLSFSEIFQSQIFWQIRLPRVILAALIGLLLSVSGVILQGVLRNPLADPYILGISAGAGVGATLSLIFGFQLGFLGINSIPLFAFLFALAAVLVVYKLAQVSGRTSPETLILAGVALSAFCSAIISLIIMLKGNLQLIYFWLLGSLSYANWSNVLALIPYALFGVVITYFFSKELNALLLGEELATTLGIEVEKVKLILVGLASLMTAAAVSVSGLIGFVGLIIPHWVRLVVGPNHRFLLPLAGLSGMILMVAADAVARVVLAPMEIPIGIVMALVGAPFFLYLLRKKRTVEK